MGDVNEDLIPRLYDERRGEWFWIDNELIDEKIEEVPDKRRADALAVYTILARHANKAGVAFPGMTYLRKKTGRSKPVLIDALRELALIGALVIRTRWRDDGGRAPNWYILTEISAPVNSDNRGVETSIPGGQGSRIDGIKNTKNEEDKNATRSAKQRGGGKNQAQLLMDEIYVALKERKLSLDEGEYAFNLGRINVVIKNDKLEPREMDALPQACVEYMIVYGALDVRKALRRLRQQDMREEFLSEQRQNGEPKEDPAKKEWAESMQEETRRMMREANRKERSSSD